MKINNAPARYEGPHSQLGALIRLESFRHLDTALEAEWEAARRAARHRACPHMREHQEPRPPETTEPTMRSRGIENNIWGAVVSGWARPLADFTGMVFWNPTDMEFQAMSPRLNMIMLDLITRIRPVVDAEIEAGIAAIVVKDLASAVLTDEATNYGKHVH